MSEETEPGGARENIETRWQLLKNIMHDIAKKELGVKTKQNRMDWFDEECIVALEEKRKAYRVYIQRSTRMKWERYSELRKIASKICRRKKEYGAISN